VPSAFGEEKTMRKAIVAVGVLSLAALAAERDARACGGCFHPPNETPTVVTDHRMILSVSPQQSTLYDQIRYQGDPSSFAWVLPISGTATVGLSSDALFTVLDGTSQTTILAPNPVCPAPPPGCAVPGVQNAGGGASSADAGVTVTHHQVVGPYDTVQLHSSDPNALNTWLSTNGYAVPSDVAPIIAAYVNEHFDFLAMKLVPGAGVSAMRPVRVTTAGASPLLPLRMVAAGTGATVGVTLWVVADGRYETQNFPFFHIDDSELVWDWASQRSNYTELRASKEAAGGGKIWEIESSTTQSTSGIKTQVQYASQIYYPDAGSPEYPPIPADDAGTAGQSSQQELDADMAALFADIGANGQFRLTRMRADLAKAALANDLVLQASSDQSALSNMRRPQMTSGSPTCPSFGTCSDSPGGGGTLPGLLPGNGSGGAGGSGGHSSFSCAVTESPSPNQGWRLYSIAGVAAALGLAFASARRRRSR
jgi:hypothetical protein